MFDLKSASARLGQVFASPAQAGRCESSLAVLRQCTASQQARLGVKYAREISDLASKYERFQEEAPAAATAAGDAVELGLVG